jgi:hypothetical protein
MQLPTAGVAIALLMIGADHTRVPTCDCGAAKELAPGDALFVVVRLGIVGHGPVLRLCDAPVLIFLRDISCLWAGWRP